MAVFHATQIDIAQRIIHEFPENRFSVLLAQMQSGKTGTYLYVALECVKRELVDRVVILCGSSDTSLRAQLFEDLEIARTTYLQETDPEGNLPRRLTDKFADINVFFSQDLKDIREITERTLIIHDESHMAQSKNNLPYKRFYKDNDLSSALLGDFRKLVERDIYILGVSATPFSEIVSNKKVDTDTWTREEKDAIEAEGIELGIKRFHFMNPSADYIGVTELLRCGAIQFTADPISANGCTRIGEILQSGQAKYNKKYLVIRTHCAGYDADVMQALASINGYDYKSVFGQGTKQGQGQGTKHKLGLEFMKEAPYRGCIIHICGRFRMGQVVPKQHIAMVYEQSKKPNADTILQGLVGRMCGYRTGGAHTDVDIFVSPTAEELIHLYDRAWSENEMDRLCEVTRAMNLGGTKRRNGGDIVKRVQDGVSQMFIKTIPIRFSLNQLERGFEGETKFCQITAESLHHLFTILHPELIEDNPDKERIMTTLEILSRGIIVDGRSTDKPHLNKEKTHPEHREKYEEALTSEKRMNFTTYGATSDIRLSIYGGGADGICYLLAFVPYDPEIHPPESVEIAAVNPKCNYVPWKDVALEDGSIIENVNGGQLIEFSINTAQDPVLLQQSLREAILRTTVGHESFNPACQRSITSLFDKRANAYEGIRLEKDVYSAEKIAEIKEALEAELSVTIILKKSRGRQPKDYHKYASISW